MTMCSRWQLQPLNLMSMMGRARPRLLGLAPVPQLRHPRGQMTAPWVLSFAWHWLASSWMYSSPRQCLPVHSSGAPWHQPPLQFLPLMSI